MQLENLRLLKKDMENKHWTICGFLFCYKGIKYIVLVKRFVENEKKMNKYASVKLHFMKEEDLDIDLQVEANAGGLITDEPTICDVPTLRKYFGIAYRENLGDVLDDLTKRIGKVIPEIVPEVRTELEKWRWFDH